MVDNRNGTFIDGWSWDANPIYDKKGNPIYDFKIDWGERR